MNRVGLRLIGAIGLFAALVPPTSAVAQDQPLKCGAGDVERASLTALQPDNAIDLGRSNSGSRSWEITFVWDTSCVIDKVDANIRTLQGEDASLAGDAIKAKVSDYGEQRLIVTVEVHRDEVPPGRFVGTVEVTGEAVGGVASASVTVSQQEPISKGSMSALEQLLWIFVCAVVVGALVLSRARDWAAASLLDPMIVLAAAVLLYPVVGWLQGGDVPALWWPVWLGATGLIGGFLVAVLKYTNTSGGVSGGVRYGAAMAISFGAGLTTWKSQYLDAADWALTFERAFVLISVVGAATVTSALLLLQPAPKGDADTGSGDNG